MNKTKLIFYWAIIFAFIFLFWRGVLHQALLGEGFIYMQPEYARMVQGYEGRTFLLTRYDVFPLLFFYIFGPYIKDNVTIHMILVLFWLTLVNLGLFVFIKKITRNTKTASLSVILFSTSYIGSFQLIGSGYSFPAFMQRVPTFFLIFISLIFLHQFLQTKKTKYYIYSIVVFFISMFLAHYNFILLPLFFIYCFLGMVIGSKTRKTVDFVKALMFSFIYFLISYPFVKLQAIGGAANEGFLAFFKNGVWIFKEVAHEIVILTIPPQVPKNLASIILSLFFVFSILIYRKSKKLRVFWISLICSIPIVIFMLMYMNYTAFWNTYDSNRYFYIPSLLISIFWAIVLSRLSSKHWIQKLFVAFLVLMWIYYNSVLVNRGFQVAMEDNNKVLLTQQFIHNTNNNFPSGSIVIVEDKLSNYNVEIINRYYGVTNNIQFVRKSESSHYLNAFPNIIELNYKNGKIFKEILRSSP